MRTTLEIDDDVMAVARELARSRGVSIGSVVSDLARTALRPTRIDVVDGLPLIRGRKGAPLITGDMVRRALDDE